MNTIPAILIWQNVSKISHFTTDFENYVAIC